MKFMVLLLALSYVVRTGGSLNDLPVHPGVGGLYRGPNSETIIKGPDGSVITAEVQGGTIDTQGTLEPIVVADLDVQPGIPAISGLSLESVAPSIVAAPAVVAPALVTVTEIPLTHTIEIVQPDPHIIQTEIVDAPIVEPQQSSDLIGPSGSISTRGSSSVISGPASTTISEPARVLVAAPVVAAVPVVASVTTPLLSAPAVPVIPDSVATASIALQPTISTVEVGSTINSAIHISTIAPPTSWEPERISSATILSPQNGEISPNIIISTQAPPTILNRQDGPNSYLLSTNPANLGGSQESIEAPGEIVRIGQLSASVEPASSYGVLNNIANPVQISSTVRPDVSVTPPFFPPTTPSQVLLPPHVPQVNLGIPVANHNSLNQAGINNRELYVNPSLIPSANIIPSEIGPHPAEAIRLTNRITVSSNPIGPELYSPTESSNIQRTSEVDTAIVDNNIRNTDETLIYSNGRLGQLDENRQTFIQNLVTNPGRSVDINVLPSSQTGPIQINPPLLRDTHPIQTGIYQNGWTGAQLSKYGIDGSQINLSNVPLSSVIPLEASGPLPLSQNIEDSSSVLWNRYGRDVKIKKN